MLAPDGKVQMFYWAEYHSQFAITLWGKCDCLEVGYIKLKLNLVGYIIEVGYTVLAKVGHIKLKIWGQTFVIFIVTNKCYIM